MSKINNIYNGTIGISIVVIIMATLDLIFNIINLQNEILISTIICASIGCVSVIVDKIDFNKKNNRKDKEVWTHII